MKAARALIRRRAGELGVSIAHLPGFAADGKGKGKKAKQMAAPTAGDRKLLERAAAGAGLVTMTQKEAKRLRKLERAHQAAVRDLDGQRFETAFDTALRARKAAPGEKDTLRVLYKADASATLRMLEQRPAIMPDKPLGLPTIDWTSEPQHVDRDAAARAGVHADSLELDQRVKARLRELGRPMSAYVTTLDAILNEEVG